MSGESAVFTSPTRDPADKWMDYRYHFDMLHDTGRNAAYRAAIDRVIRPTSVVVDIGAGSGLLVRDCLAFSTDSTVYGMLWY